MCPCLFCSVFFTWLRYKSSVSNFRSNRFQFHNEWLDRKHCYPGMGIKASNRNVQWRCCVKDFSDISKYFMPKIRRRHCHINAWNKTMLNIWFNTVRLVIFAKTHFLDCTFKKITSPGNINVWITQSDIYTGSNKDRATFVFQIFPFEEKLTVYDNHLKTLRCNWTVVLDSHFSLQL